MFADEKDLTQITEKDREALDLYIKLKDQCQVSPEINKAYEVLKEAEKTYRALQDNIVVPTLPEITPRLYWSPKVEYRGEYIDNYIYEELGDEVNYRAKVTISIYTGKAEGSVRFSGGLENQQHFYYSFSKEDFVDPIKAMIWCERLIDWLKEIEHAPFFLDEDDL